MTNPEVRRSGLKEEALLQLGLALDMRIRVDGEKGTWRLAGIAADGSITAVGGSYGHWRSFRPEWCYPAQRAGRGGRMVAGKLPVQNRGRRAAWRAAQATKGLAQQTQRGRTEP